MLCATTKPHAHDWPVYIAPVFWLYLHLPFTLVEASLPAPSPFTMRKDKRIPLTALVKPWSYSRSKKFVGRDLGQSAQFCLCFQASDAMTLRNVPTPSDKCTKILSILHTKTDERRACSAQWSLSSGHELAGGLRGSLSMWGISRGTLNWASLSRQWMTRSKGAARAQSNQRPSARAISLGAEKIRAHTDGLTRGGFAHFDSRQRLGWSP